jgi:hypothetical protein
VPTLESPAWDVPASAEPVENGQAKASTPPAAEPEEPKSTVAAVAATAKKTWASMFAPVPKPATPKPATKPTPSQEEPAPSTDAPTDEVVHEPVTEAEELPSIPPVADEIAEELPSAIEETSNISPEKLEEPAGPELGLTPSKDELTKDNVEHLPDTSMPPPTETAASTVASSKDIGTLASVATPLSTSGQAPIGRPGIGGFATTALKATSGSHRSASFQRRLVEQQEAVVMPGNHAVNQAAVQFGSLGLNGDADDSLDVDEDREEAETRTQPPQHSPVAQPRAALPPAPRQAPPTETQPQEIPTPKQAPGLPPAPQQQSFPQQSPSSSLAAQAMQPQGSQGRQSYDQFGRYGQGGIQSETAAPQQKSSYEAFGQQAPQSSQYDYPNQPNQQQQNQQSSQPGGFSSAPDAFASQYLTSDQQRSTYQNYYNYGQQGTPSQQEAGSAQQRTGSGFGAGPNDSTFSQSQQQQVRPLPNLRISAPVDLRPQKLGPRPTPYAERLHEPRLEQFYAEEVRKRIDNEENDHLARHPSDKRQQAHSRYSDAQNSGHNTPNPTLGGQHPSGPASQQGQQGQPMHQPHAQTGNYPYNHPYYGSPYYANYMSNYGGYGQGGYGGFGKGMYAQHHPYGMSPQSSFDQHSSSPANAGGFGASSMHGRESGLGGGLGDYGRSVSGTSQSQHNATAGSGGFGGLPDMFSRPQGGYGGQNSYGQQQGGQQGGNEDSLKPFGDNKSAGPSPSVLGAQPGRPGSATNNTPGQGGQGGMPQQSHQQGFGGYPSHLQGGQGNQYGGLGGLGHQGGGNHQQQQQQQQQSGYGNYSGFGGGYGSYNRGGWGTNYGQH